MEQVKVLITSTYVFIQNDLDYGGDDAIDKRSYQEVPQHQNPLETLRSVILSSENVLEDEQKEFWITKQMESQENVSNTNGDGYQQYQLLDGVKVNGTLYVDLNQCIKML